MEALHKTDLPLSKKHVIFKLLLSTLYISTFTFGGGFVIVTFMKKKFIDELHWIDETELLDLTALAQASPGSIAVNASMLIGWRIAGIAGMFTAIIGTILPPIIIISVISLFYTAFASNLYVSLLLKGMQAGVAAVILDVACELGTNVFKEKSFLSDVIMIAAFLATFFFNINVIFIILVSATAGVVKALFFMHKGDIR